MFLTIAAQSGLKLFSEGRIWRRAWQALAAHREAPQRSQKGSLSRAETDYPMDEIGPVRETSFVTFAEDLARRCRAYDGREIDFRCGVRVNGPNCSPGAAEGVLRAGGGVELLGGVELRGSVNVSECVAAGQVLSVKIACPLASVHLLTACEGVLAMASMAPTNENPLLNPWRIGSVSDAETGTVAQATTLRV